MANGDEVLEVLLNRDHRILFPQYVGGLLCNHHLKWAIIGPNVRFYKRIISVLVLLLLFYNKGVLTYK